MLTENFIAGLVIKERLTFTQLLNKCCDYLESVYNNKDTSKMSSFDILSDYLNTFLSMAAFQKNDRWRYDFMLVALSAQDAGYAVNVHIDNEVISTYQGVGKVYRVCCIPINIYLFMKNELQLDCTMYSDAAQVDAMLGVIMSAGSSTVSDKMLYLVAFGVCIGRSRAINDAYSQSAVRLLIMLTEKGYIIKKNKEYTATQVLAECCRVAYSLGTVHSMYDALKLYFCILDVGADKDTKVEFLQAMKSVYDRNGIQGVVDAVLRNVVDIINIPNAREVTIEEMYNSVIDNYFGQEGKT